MIIKIKKNTEEEQVYKLSYALKKKEIEHKVVSLKDRTSIVTSSCFKDEGKFLEQFKSIIESCVDLKSDYQLSTRKYQSENTIIDLGNGAVFGSDKTVMIAGPCAIESEDQIMRAAEYLVANHGIKVFRAGAFKPRTSPYTFQGLETEGLELLDKVRREFGVKIATEIKDETHLDEVSDCADIVQIGTKSMYIFNMLQSCGKIKKPVILKRGFMATIKEFLQAADFIMSNGNPDVILCERGIRTFETQTRFSLDICSTALLREVSHLPIILDPSHAMGKTAQVPLIAQASAAMEVDGIMIEAHPEPAQAKCDKDQALSLEEYTKMVKKLESVCKAVGRTLE